MNFTIYKTLSLSLTYRHICFSSFLKRSLLYSLHSFFTNACYVPISSIDYWCISDRCAAFGRVDEQTAIHLLVLLQNCLQTRGQKLKLSTWALCATTKYNFIPCSMGSPSLALDPTHMPAVATHFESLRTPNVHSLLEKSVPCKLFFPDQWASLSVAIPDTVSGRIGDVVSDTWVHVMKLGLFGWVGVKRKKQTNTDNSQGCDFALTQGKSWLLNILACVLLGKLHHHPFGLSDFCENEVIVTHCWVVGRIKWDHKVLVVQEIIVGGGDTMAYSCLLVHHYHH